MICLHKQRCYRSLMWSHVVQVIELNALGRLLTYDPESGRLAVLLDSLYMPNGLALSPDEDFLLLAETSIGRILRYTHTDMHGWTHMHMLIPNAHTNTHTHMHTYTHTLIPMLRTHTH